MTTKDEALKLALEALKIGYDYAAEETERFHVEMAGYKPKRHEAMDADVRQIDDAITAIHEALAQQQEPVVTKTEEGMTLHVGWDDLPVGTKLYTSPPKREWVGLTDEEIRTMWQNTAPYYDHEYFARAIEAKLKEQNT